MPKHEDIQGGLFLSNGVKYNLIEIKEGKTGAIIWPTAYRGVIWADNFSSTSAIAAAGGYISFRWYYAIYRGTDTTPLETGVIGDPQNVSVTMSDAANFHLSYLGQITNISADNRGRNNLPASGWTAPVNADPRSTTITSASYTMMYGQARFTATLREPFSVTQARNHYRTNGSASYDVTSFSVDDYTSQATQAPASGGSTVWSANATITQPYIFDSGATYSHYSDGSSSVTALASVGWLDVSGNTITVSGRGTDQGTVRYALLTPYVGSTSYPSRAVMLYQQENQIVETVKTYTGAEITGLSTKWGSLASNTAPSRGSDGTITFTAIKNYTSENVYTSGSRAAGASGSESATIASGGVQVYSKPAWITSVTDSSITASAQSNSGTTQRSGTLTLRVYYTASLYRSAFVTITQLGTVVTYDIVCRSHPNGVYLPASASTVNLIFDGYIHYDNGSADTVRQDVYGRYKSGSDISGRISHGVGTVTSVNLGTLPYDEVGTTYTYEWSSYPSATCQVAVTQSYNRVEQRQEGSWVEGAKVYGSPYQEILPNSHTVSASVDAYGSESSPAPKTGGTATLSVIARHQERTATPWSRTDTRTDTLTWTSGQSSTETAANSVTGTDYTAYSYIDDTYDVIAEPTSMLSVNGNTVTISANTGNARHGLISVYNSSSVSYVHMYQRAGNVALEVSESRLTFSKFGGTQTFTISATSTGWTRELSYTSTRSPFVNGSVTPESGNDGDTTITVVIAEHPSSIYGSERRLGYITFIATEDPDVTAVVRVEQYPDIGDGN